nr:integumentary mucin C.1-like [Ciona intestinalis]|eukprot:XP_002119885.2 integumentary mucin C.1-like [Ciona intestinalis]
MRILKMTFLLEERIFLQLLHYPLDPDDELSSSSFSSSSGGFSFSTESLEASLPPTEATTVELPPDEDFEDDLPPGGEDLFTTPPLPPDHEDNSSSSSSSSFSSSFSEGSSDGDDTASTTTTTTTTETTTPTTTTTTTPIVTTTIPEPFTTTPFGSFFIGKRRKRSVQPQQTGNSDRRYLCPEVTGATPRMTVWNTSGQQVELFHYGGRFQWYAEVKCDPSACNNNNVLGCTQRYSKQKAAVIVQTGASIDVIIDDVMIESSCAPSLPY